MLVVTAPLRAAVFVAAFALTGLPVCAQTAAPKKSAQSVPLPPPRPHFTIVEQTSAAPRAEKTAELRVSASSDSVRDLVSLYAQRHGVPERLAHRIVAQESRYNPGLKGRAHFGLMQISLPTAKQMGYSGAPQGLLDARTNLAYGMPYLANAWIVADGNETRAASLYSRGYYYDAKRKNLLKSLRTAKSEPVRPLEEEEVAVAE